MIASADQYEASLAAVHPDVLMPKLQAGVAGGFQSPPQESTVDVYKLMP